MADENVESDQVTSDMFRKASEKIDAKYRETMLADDSLPETITSISDRGGEQLAKPASTDGGGNTSPEIIDKTAKFNASSYRVRQSGPGEAGLIGNPLDILTKLPQTDSSEPPPIKPADPQK